MKQLGAIIIAMMAFGEVPVDGIIGMALQGLWTFGCLYLCGRMWQSGKVEKA